MQDAVIISQQGWVFLKYYCVYQMNLSFSKDFSSPNLILNWPVILVMHLAFVLDQDLITYTAYKEEMEFVILEPRLLKSVTSFAMID